MRRHLPMTNQGMTWICHLPMARWPPHVTEKRDWPKRPKNVCAAFQHTQQKVIRRKYNGTLFQYALDFNRGGQDHTLRQSHYIHKLSQQIFQFGISHTPPQSASLTTSLITSLVTESDISSYPEDVPLEEIVLGAVVGESISNCRSSRRTRRTRERCAPHGRAPLHAKARQ